MSGLHQPLLIANSNYHVGHQISVRVAEERGFFAEEGFHHYVYEHRGLLPGEFEREVLGRVLWEQGIDIATAVNVGSAVWQRAHGADLHIVAGWRFPPNLKFVGGRHITGFQDLKGRRIGTRERGDLAQQHMVNALRRAGIDPDRECEWVHDATFAYGNSPRQMEMLATGTVDALPSQPPFTQRLLEAGFPLVLDPLAEYPVGRPDKVVVATSRVIEERAEELGAFLRAHLRGLWLMRDVGEYDYLRDLEARLRADSRNDDERRLAIITSGEKVEGWALPINGGLSIREGDSVVALQQVIEEMRATGQLDRGVDADDVLRIQHAEEALTALRARPALESAWQRARAAAEKYGC